MGNEYGLLGPNEKRLRQDIGGGGAGGAGAALPAGLYPTLKRDADRHVLIHVRLPLLDGTCADCFVANMSGSGAERRYRKGQLPSLLPRLRVLY